MTKLSDSSLGALIYKNKNTHIYIKDLLITIF